MFHGISTQGSGEYPGQQQSLPHSSSTPSFAALSNMFSTPPPPTTAPVSHVVNNGKLPFTYSPQLEFSLVNLFFPLPPPIIRPNYIPIWEAVSGWWYNLVIKELLLGNILQDLSCGQKLMGYKRETINIWKYFSVHMCGHSCVCACTHAYVHGYFCLYIFST